MAKARFTVYDSYTRKKQPLVTGETDELAMYICGPTVYQRIHVGNARVFAMFMAFTRYLRARGFTVKLVSNITDVNDKIYRAAAEQGMASTELAQQATQWYVEDTNRLGLGRPDIEPRASASIDNIIALIKQLVAEDVAYEVDGDVYFAVENFRHYGRLSNQQTDQMLENARDLDTGKGKRNPLDFALWKAAKDGEDTSWESPWGTGRPGWHIECSAMAHSELGDAFDIHGGGLDLIFPHHENEIAQSRAAGQQFARLWMHVGMLSTGGEKMSKSLGNIRSLASVLDEHPAWVLLLLYYGASYRNPLEFGDEALAEATAQGNRIREALRRGQQYLGSIQTRNTGDPTFVDTRDGWAGIHEALEDDFNTANALAELFGLVYDLNTAVDEHATPQVVRNLRGTIIEVLQLFGLGAIIPEDLQLDDEVRALVAARDAARERKDFAESDRLRDELHKRGYDVRDTDAGTQLAPAAS